MTDAPPRASLPELLARAAECWPDRTAAVFPSDRLTFGQLRERAVELAGALIAQGVGPGDHVGLLMPNSTELLITFFGTCLAGARPVTLNTRYRSDELPYVVAHADLVAVLTTAYRTTNNAGDLVDYVRRLQDAIPELAQQSAEVDFEVADAPALRFVGTLGDRDEPWVRTLHPVPVAESVIEQLSAVPDLAAEAMLLYTSGTTARPKGVVLSHRSMVTTCTSGAVDRLGLAPGEVIWNPAPMCHISAFVAVIGALSSGATYLSEPYFDPEVALRQLVQERVTVAFANFPAFYFALGALIVDRGITLPALRLVTTAAAPPEVRRIAALFAPAEQVSVTGSTEVSGTMCINDLTDTSDQRANTAGRPLAGIELSIREPDTLQAMSPGEIGEIWVRGSCLFSGYYRDPEPVVTGDPDPGWFRTADLGVLDDGGRLAFRGRLKDMLKVGGENVSAAEVETYLLSHPAVAVAQVVAMPDERLGEVPAAFVELGPGATADEPELLDYCRAGIARYKVPRVVRFVTEWPMSATKIQKDKLRAQL